MALYEVTAERLQRVEETTLGVQGLRERDDLQRLLRHQIEAIVPDLMVITEEFGDWEESRRRIDLLCLDKDANLVVVELKRTEDGGHVELQAIRYAAMVSTMTFEQVVEAHAAFRVKCGLEGDARSEILDFLGWSDPSEQAFAQDVRVVLVSGNFSREITTAVMWLNQRGLDIRCVRLRTHTFDGRVLVDVQQIIPLPEAADYQIKVRAKQQQERVATQTLRDYTKYDVTVGGKMYPQLAKRHAVLRAVQGVCARGVTPQQVSEATPLSHERLWFWVEGEVDGSTFLEKASASPRKFDERRWACEEDQLIYSEGRTWAFRNQWGPNTTIVLDALMEAFPEVGLSYKAVNPET